jgi:hypothetical protein
MGLHAIPSNRGSAPASGQLGPREKTRASARPTWLCIIFEARIDRAAPIRYS